MNRDDINRLQAEDVSALAAACVNGAAPPCGGACPFGVEVRSFIQKVEKGRDAAAFKTYRDAVVFPILVSALCPAPCEGACVRAALGGSIDLLNLERFVVGRAKNTRRDSYVIPQKEKRIAIVGAGAAGLSAALCLSLKRYRVTVFEREADWGGELRTHADFGDFDAEFRASFEPLDTEFHFNSEISGYGNLTGFDAIYLATGRAVPAPAEPRDGVFLGGGLVGADLMNSIAQGRQVATQIEAYVQTGAFTEPVAAQCDWTPETDDVPDVPRVIPSQDGGGFTVEEARAEAARCLKCDCDKCVRGCEMLARFHKLPQKIASEVYSDTRANPPFAAHTITREAYSCNDCGYCKSGCQKGIDVGEILRLSRRTRVAADSAPPALHDYWLREMDFSTEPAAFVSAGIGKNTCEYVFFPGCQLGAYNPAHVTRTLELLRGSYDVGIYLGCCGAPAYWAGDDARLEANLAQIRDNRRSLGAPKFIFACTTCAKIFAELLPEIEGVSLYSLLAESGVAAPSGTADFPAAFAHSVIFDPCASNGDEETQNAVRAVVSGLGVELDELPERGKCCGYGGNIQLANPSLYDEITANRAAESDLPYIVYCANCRQVFAERGKECAHILDIILGLDPAPSPDIDGRRRNSLEVKRVIADSFAGVSVSPPENPWDSVVLKIDAETAERADRKLIAQSEIREAIFLAERDRVYFERSDGVRQCSQAKPALVYWVTYKPLRENEYKVIDAYYHRMKFEGADDND
ncbi:MAG: NAD(P)-binding protein [Oscillospiraceae bacterium]|jgi:Fe-S oxidoreductase|nr:NAD(P)-binding protein [Oscillospiraceae bacterium]